VTHTWNAIVVPNQILLIGLLAVFEATAGVLTISGHRHRRDRQPSSAGKWVGQPTPRRTTRSAAAMGIAHDQLSA
jgi:hypothetical protein